MLDLVREGLVVAMPNRGFRVTEVSSHDLAEVTELRLFLEPPAVEKATPLIPASAFAELRSKADDIVEAADRGDLVEYLSADSDFHLAILHYAGNARLTQLIQSLRSQTRLFGLAELYQRVLSPGPPKSTTRSWMRSRPAMRSPRATSCSRTSST